MNNHNFRLDYLGDRYPYTLGRKHPLVSLSKVLFSSMSNPSFYNIHNKQVEPTPEPVPLDPNLYANLDALLDKYGLSGSDVSTMTDTLNKGYWELLYQDSVTGKWYDYASENMTIQNIDPANYDYVTGKPSYVSNILENGKRFTYYTESYLIHSNIQPTEQWPTMKYVPFKNNPNLSSPLKLIATLDSLSAQSYVPRAVSRTSCFVFGPAATCFLLIYRPPSNIGELAIYCMQTWTNSTYKELDPLTNMCYLNTYLSDSTEVSPILPQYWTFTQCIMGNETMIALFSNPSLGIYAQVISDAIGNSYQYIRPEEAPFLYDELS